MKVSDIIIYIMTNMWRDFKKIRSSRYKKALMVQILNEVAFGQVVREWVSFQDRKSENAPKFPSIEIWY